MARALLAACAAIAVTGAACGGQDNPLANTYELSGRVTDRTTGQGVGGATVTFVSETLYEAEATTGGDGKYEMSVRTDSPFGQVRAEKEGYLADEKTVYFDSPQRRIDLGLRQVTP